MTIAVADFYSESNWNAILALWPEEQRAKASTYAETAKDLDAYMEAFKSQGLNAHRTRVMYAAYQFEKEQRGLLTRSDE